MRPDGPRTYVYSFVNEIYTITYDLNVGIYDGSVENVIEAYPEGTIIHILDAPSKNGYTFQHWQGPEYYPGDEYKVTGDHTFTAIWKKDQEPIPPYVPPKTGIE